MNRIPTGREFHRYVNPERDVPADAVAVHGLSAEFLKDKPLFSAVAEEFLDFIGDDGARHPQRQPSTSASSTPSSRVSSGPELTMERVTCTLQLARRRHPAGPNSLDALCKRYGIDNSKRTKHGALMDSVLLAEVYVELLGVRQAALGLAMEGTAPLNGETGAFHKRKAAQRPAPLPSRLTAEAEAEHRAFIETLGVKALWRRYLAFAASVSSPPEKV